MNTKLLALLTILASFGMLSIVGAQVATNANGIQYSIAPQISDSGAGFCAWYLPFPKGCNYSTIEGVPTMLNQTVQVTTYNQSVNVTNVSITTTIVSNMTNATPIQVTHMNSQVETEQSQVQQHPSYLDEVIAYIEILMQKL